MKDCKDTGEERRRNDIDSKLGEERQRKSTDTEA